jgi:hypothetical protein
MLYTHLSSWTGTIGQLEVDVPSGLSLIQTHEVKKKEEEEKKEKKEKKEEGEDTPV